MSFGDQPPKKRTKFFIQDLLGMSSAAAAHNQQQIGCGVKSEENEHDINGIDLAEDGTNLNKYLSVVYDGDGDVEFNEKFKTLKWRSTFLIESLPADPEELLRSLFQKCIDQALEEAKANGTDPDNLGITIASRLLNPDIWIPIRPLSENTVDAALNRFKIVAQSKTNEGNLYGEAFTVTVTTVDKRQMAKNFGASGSLKGSGGGGSGGGYRNLAPVQHRIRRKCLIPVKNLTDTYCLFHALHLTYIHKMKLMSKQMSWNFVHRDHMRRCDEVEQFMMDASVPRGLPEYDARIVTPLIVNYWNKLGKRNGLRYKVFIFERCGHYKPAYMYGPENFNIPIAIYYDTNHFWGVRSVASLFKKNNYCLSCLSVYGDSRLHRKDCKKLCLCCGRIGFGCSFVQEKLTYQKFCKECSKTFVNRKCYEAHKENRFCQMSKKCMECGVIWDVAANTRNGRPGHNCMERYCAPCDCFHSKERGCFIQPFPPRDALPVYRCIAFDFETVQDQVVDAERGKKIHEVNFAAVVVFCTKCIENGIWMNSLSQQQQHQNSCPICGPIRTITFSHRPHQGTAVDKQIVTDNPLKEFVNWVVLGHSTAYMTMAFAHYGGRFDIVMVFREIFNMNAECSLIRRGNKLYQLRVESQEETNPLILFRDSYNLFPIPLGKLIGAFGLSGIQDKPFFPYLANSKKFYDRTLPSLPNKDLYLWRGFMPTKKVEFEKWYEQNCQREFCLNNELASYCMNDCRILAAALVAFRKEFLEITSGPNGVRQGMQLGIDPLRDGVTISSNCLLNFRLNHLKSDQHIGVVPENGYDTCDSQSTLALKFFKWFSEKFDVQLKTAHNGGEKQIGQYRLDAYYENTKGEKIGMECHGCVFHAHRCKYPEENHLIKPVGKTAGWIRKKDEIREQYLRQHLTRLDIIFECQINKMLKRDKEMRRVFNEYMDEGPIQIREHGFFGGRTGPMKIYHHVKEGEAIGYLDFRSLYPDTNFSTSYPIKHPKVFKFTGKEQKIEWTKPEDCPYNGFVKVLLTTPEHCAIPPLPVKFDNRLLFPLCRACSLKYPEGGWAEKYDCPHNDQQRSWVATATTIELKEALCDGFKAERLFRALHFPDDQWDDSLFKNYVATFMTIKTHSSGFPTGIDTVEKEEQFISECFERFGMKIEREKMIKNEARRTLSKLCLNSLWGRFGLRNDLSRSLVTDSPEELCKLLNNRSIEISSIDELTAQVILVTYDTKREYIIENEGSNVIISAWTTSAARIKLLGAMRKITRCPGAELLYTDTDSCIYSYKIGQNPLETGDHLGDLASEIPKGNEIVEFVCAGSKQYGLKLRKEGGSAAQYEYVLKLRGFSLNYLASLQLNYETFKQQVLTFARGSKAEPIGITYPLFIRPDIRTGTVTSSPLKKVYKPVLSKGILGPDFYVRTFGERKKEGKI